MNRIWTCAAAAAALLAAGAPASAASFIGNDVVIKRVQGGSTVFKTVSTTVGTGFEYDDNFFRIDVTENEVVFDAIAGFSIGDVFYEIAGLDFDGDPATPNAIQGFAVTQIVGPGLVPIDASRATIQPGGQFRMSFASTTGGSNGLARITFGAASPAAVPEPATWAMLIAGFGMVGGALRRSPRREGVYV